MVAINIMLNHLKESGKGSSFEALRKLISADISAEVPPLDPVFLPDEFTCPAPLLYTIPASAGATGVIIIVNKITIANISFRLELFGTLILTAAKNEQLIQTVMYYTTNKNVLQLSPHY